VDVTRRDALPLDAEPGKEPDGTHWSAILDALGTAGVGATFFVVGSFALKHPDLVRRTGAEGHPVGGHTSTI